MGKRKKSSRKPQGPKKVGRSWEVARDYVETPQREPLATAFPCLFCNHEKSVTVKMDKKAGTGGLMCKVCGQQFQTGINCQYSHCGFCFHQDYAADRAVLDLSAAVDVYSDWIDACDAVAKEAVGEAATSSQSYADQYTGSSNRMGSTQLDRGTAVEIEDDADNEGDYDDAL